MDPRLRRIYSRCIVEVERGTLPDLVNDRYDYLMIDLASITYGLKNPRAFLMNVRLALDYDYLRPSVVFVIDHSRPEHKAVAETRVKWFRELGLDYMLAEDEPAEVRAARECMRRGKCIVLSRDYDPLTVMDEMIQPIKITEMAWINRKITINKECLSNYLKKKNN
ncbi:hypothetical protein [Vulcanisaeta souniana]|uniref:Uncharacterized protein n=1 Tax=Vulcanisaeta souniana JCM 11219 TaxID=1293586 RepID=A0A830E698_9CREN|nr:hypothetical protein [Vulcanisaeta souniana]BDR93076.1 hypothetical protein Vsou_21690 [Vulcanisaeta souniana JCM 11219]GGI87265.1 hypothetical protein GCM10007112_25220 [Vulcanisaeta souniana JCM 11219]